MDDYCRYGLRTAMSRRHRYTITHVADGGIFLNWSVAHNGGRATALIAFFANNGDHAALARVRRSWDYGAAVCDGPSKRVALSVTAVVAGPAVQINGGRFSLATTTFGLNGGRRRRVGREICRFDQVVIGGLMALI